MKYALLAISFFFVTTLSFSQATANQPSDLEVCDDLPNDGFATFNLTQTEPEILGAQNPALYTITYHQTEVDAQANVNAIFDPNNYINIVNPQTIYARLENLSNGDFDVTDFAIIVLPNPFAQAPSDIEVCDDNNDGFATFDLTSRETEITGGAVGVTVTYHLGLGDATNGINPLASPYINTTPNSQIIYIRVEDDITGCFSLADMDIVVLPIPEPQQPNNLFINEGDGDGVAEFNLTVNDAVVSVGVTNPQVFYFETLVNAEQLVDAITTPNAYTNTSNPQEIFVAVQNGDTDCFDVISFLIATDETDLPDGDDDSVPDAIEDINANGDLMDDDSDNDTIPNFMDNDDDGDGTLTVNEDYNSNGSPTDDDTNANRIPDYLDPDVVLEIDELDVSAVEIYPNPVSDRVTVFFGNSFTKATISVFTSNGSIVFEGDISETSLTTIDTASYFAGIYFVTITTDGTSTTKKFIKK